MKGTMTRLRRILATLAVLGTLLSACGGGGSSSTSPTPTPTPDPTPDPTPAAPTELGWSPPQYFTDNSSLDPVRDLERFEIYIKQDPLFSLDEYPVAIAPPGVTTIDLATLSPPLSRGAIYFFTVRAVPVDGEISEFSDVGTFFLP